MPDKDTKGGGWRKYLPHRHQKDDDATTNAPEAATPQSSNPSNATTVIKKSITSEELWTMASEMASKRNPQLMANYSQYLSKNNVSDAFSAAGSAKTIMDTLGKDREAKQWHLSIFGQDIKLREQGENLLKLLIWSDDIVKEALSSQPHVALAWTAVSMILPLLESVLTQQADMLEGFSRISHVQLYWKICEKNYIGDIHARSQSDDFVDALAGLYSSILEYQASAVCHLSSKQLSRAWEKITVASDWASMAENIESRSKNCQAYLEASLKISVKEILEQQLQEMGENYRVFSDIHRLIESHGQLVAKHYEDDRDQKIFEDLSNSYEEGKDLNPDRVRGTCEWFLGDKAFHDWRDTDASGLLLLVGGPGCGKSVLSRHLINNELPPIRITTTISNGQVSTSVANSTICYFFFKDGAEGRMDASDALSAILHQLFAGDSTGQLIKKAYKSYKEKGSAFSQNFITLWDIFEDCVKSLDRTTEVICVLDALDECAEISRDRLIKYLATFLSSAQSKRLPRVKFLVTSRPYDSVTRSLCTISKDAFYQVDADCKIDEISSEIDIVIDNQLENILGMPNAEDYKGLSDYLKNTRSRTYLWVHLVLGFIERNRFLFRSDPNSQELLSDIPPDLDGQYERMLSNTSGGPKVERRIELLLQLVLAASTPLTLDEANTALTMALQGTAGFPSLVEMKKKQMRREFFQGEITNLLGLFVSIYNSKLYFIHQTAREFLLSSKRSDRWKWKGRLSLHGSHQTMSLACMRYLPLPLPLMQIPKPGASGPDAYYTVYPDFFLYAARNWPLHVTVLQDPVEESILQHARELCRVGKPLTETWYKAWKTSHNSIPPIDSIRKLASGDTTDIVFAALLGIVPVVRYAISQQQLHAALHTHDRLTEKHLRMLIEEYDYSSLPTHYQIMELLLDHYGDRMDISEANLGEIVFRDTGRQSILSLILSKREDLKVTESLLRLVAGNGRQAASAMTMLLQRQSDKIQISTGVVEILLANLHSTEKNALVRLLSTYGDKFPITQATVERTAGEMKCATMEALLEVCRDDIKITDELVLAAAFNGTVFEHKARSWVLFLRDEPPLMQALFEYRGDEIKITEEVLVAAAGNDSSGYKTLQEIFQRRPGTEVTMAMVGAGERNRDRDRILPLLEGRHSDDKIVAEAISTAMATAAKATERSRFLQHDRDGL